MKARVRFPGKPVPHTPHATGKEEYEGDLVGNILWCECKVMPRYPLGRFGIDMTSRATITPLEEEAPALVAKAKEQAKGKPAA